MFDLSERTHGPGPVQFCWQSNQSTYLATTGVNNAVHIWDRHGQSQDEVRLAGACTGIGWDKDGDFLAIINDRSSSITLWDANSNKTSIVESGFKDQLTFLSWSKVSSVLAVGTQKGNLLLYNHKTSKKLPILGKHTKKISCGVWSSTGLLALGSEDKTITLNNGDGETMRLLTLRDIPSDLTFAEMKTDAPSPDNTLSLVVGHKTLLLLNLADPDNPLELAFQARYGNITSYRWYGDGYVLLGFSAGFFVVISTHIKEIGTEIFLSRNHKDSLSCVAVSPVLGKAASCGDNIIKVHDLSDMREVYDVITLEEERSLDKLSWTDDGQLLAVSSPRGTMYVYLSRLPSLGAAHGTRIAYLTSLLEVTIVDPIHHDRPLTVSIEVEPSFVGVGPYHVAAGMNNRAWFYLLSEGNLERLRDREYLGTVNHICLNTDYAAVSFEGKVQLHVIEAESESRPAAAEERESKLFPDREHGNESSIACHALTNDFLVYGTSSGQIVFFLLEDWNSVNEYRHPVGVKKIFADNAGTRVVFIDDKADAFVYNPVNDHCVDVPSLSAATQGILWDNWMTDKGTFAAYDNDSVYTYFYMRESIHGPSCNLIGQTKLPYGSKPLMMYNGEVTLLLQSGKTSTLQLASHVFIERIQDLPPIEIMEVIQKCIALSRFKDAWHYSLQLPKTEANSVWGRLARAAMEALDVAFAIRVYRHVGNVGMVASLSKIEQVDDRNLLGGYLAMFMGETDLAQSLFLESSQQKVALEMRQDLLQWDQALKLAKALAPQQIPFISKEYAQQLEFLGDFPLALQHFEKGLTNSPANEEHDEGCRGGMARMSIRLGNIQRGVQMALKSNSRQLKKECAAILEGMKQLTEAAMLYEKGEFYDKAASVYIKTKNWSKVGELLPNLTSPKIYAQYAKAREVDGKYQDAASAYEKAKDFDNVIRIQLDHLKNPEAAVAVVKQTGSVEGAKMVARFFQKLNDYGSAIKFLVMSKCNEEAFQMAQSHGQMELYADIIGSDATPDDYQSIALHFENNKRHFLAGKFFLLCKQHARALKHFLRCPSSTGDNQFIEMAIETVGEANDDTLTHQLIDYLMGETDGAPKDAKYLFRLYMALHQHREAARTAIIIAREEQNAGNYRNAHDVLHSMHAQLRQRHIKIPAEMASNLMILHSYVVVKLHVKHGEHLKAARLLIRVANNISKFPSHVVPILTSTVIECHRAGLKTSAFSYAAMLMRPEYRNDIDARYKKKIEAIVRRPDKTDEEEPQSPCPYCNNNFGDMELVCPNCNNNVPYCVVTGAHMSRESFSCCPSCKHPALIEEFLQFLSLEETCPMCGEKVLTENVTKITDLEDYLNPKEEE